MASPSPTIAMLALCLLAVRGGAEPAREPADILQERYAAAARDFRVLAARFPALVEAPASPAGTRRLRREVAALRAAYKRMEYLVDYAHPGTSARLNPPPLDRADLPAPGSTDVIPPEGLQILLGIAHEDNPLADRRERLRTLALRLQEAAGEWEAAAARLVLDDRMLFEAMQNQVIRVMTIGITGFDAPATELSLPESRLSLEALRPTVALYLPELRRRDAVLAARLGRALDAAIAAIPRGADFDAFDRLAFIRKAGNPLYAALIDAQRALGIATFSDFAPLRRPVSVTARNLFAPDFMDAHYYSRTPGEKPDSTVAALGRRLFFDPVLSADEKGSCASCHEPRRAFSDGLPKSPAFNGDGTLLRNAPALTHAAYQGEQFWDLRERTLERQIQHVVAGTGEFNNDFLVIMERLKRRPEYDLLFRAAFPGEADPVNVHALTKALAMYLRTLGNWNSPFDRYMRGESASLDPAARRGFNLFMGKAACATCHFPPAFNGVVPPRYLDTESEVLGVPERFPAKPLVLDADLGRGMIHQSPIFRRAFKTPTVRNVELSGPYMHNGGMATLEAVLDFYNAGGGLGLGLDVPNQTLPADSLGLTRREMDDIIAFMKALTDTTGLGSGGGGY